MKSIFVMLLVAASRTVAGQTSCSVSGGVGTCSPASLSTPGTIVNPRIIRLTVSTDAVSGSASAATYDDGFVAITGPTVTVRANRTWTVQVSAATANWSRSGSLARSDKPARDLSWSVNGSSGFSALSTSAATVKSGSATASDVTNIYFRAALDWAADTPGTYSMRVNFTVTTP